MRKHIWKKLMTVVAALVVANSGMADSTVPTASAEPASEASELPRPLPTCAEAGAFFCDTINEHWDCYESDIGVWFQKACNSDTPGCET